ncbi:MAG: DUF6883 domain-containing protein [Cyanophyceae cyanobacterium]
MRQAIAPSASPKPAEPTPKFSALPCSHRVWGEIPGGDRAQRSNKIDDYCLNPNHRKGQHKARLFQKRLGITQENTQRLKYAIH